MKIVFQGDSITDVGRNTNNGSTVSLGQGYPLMIAGELCSRYPGKIDIVNRGISGNRIVDVYARIKADCWNLCPDLFSILIGVNDVWHEFGGANGVDAKRFEIIYDLLLGGTAERFPNAKVFVLEPFVLRGTATDSVWDAFYSEVRLRAEASERIAEKYGQIFIPLQKPFEAACEGNSSAYWLADGVHPTPAGHKLIAGEWLNAFAKAFPTVK